MEGEFVMGKNKAMETIIKEINYVVRDPDGTLWGSSNKPQRENIARDWESYDSDVLMRIEETPYFQPIPLDQDEPWFIGLMSEETKMDVIELTPIEYAEDGELLEMEPVPDNELCGDAIRNVKHYFGIFDLEVETVLQNFIPKFQDAYIGHRVASAVEYLLRSPEKNGIEDVKKAHRNLEQAIEHYENRGAGIL